MKRGYSKIWVDNEFKRKLKMLAIERNTTVVNISSMLARNDNIEEELKGYMKKRKNYGMQY